MKSYLCQPRVLNIILKESILFTFVEGGPTKINHLYSIHSQLLIQKKKKNEIRSIYVLSSKLIENNILITLL